MPNITTDHAITYTNFNIGPINTKLEICVLSDYVGLDHVVYPMPTTQYANRGDR